MNDQITSLLQDKSIEPMLKAERVATLLHGFPDEGAAEAVAQFRQADANAMYLVNYLSVLAGYDGEKRALMEQALTDPVLARAATNLVGSMPAEIVERIIDRFLQDQSDKNMYNLAYEVARNFPDQLREHARDLKDKDLVDALLVNGPDSWAVEAGQEFRRTYNAEQLIDLGRFRTDEALDQMISAEHGCPAHLKEMLYEMIESSGVFPETREVSTYNETLRGFIVDRGRSPHQMGDKDGPVPSCMVCDQPADRILTLRAAELPALDIVARFDPTLFWITCAHAGPYVFASFDAAGAHGIMAGAAPEAATGVVPGERAMLLVTHPNQHGEPFETFPGFGRHQVGGYPPWVQRERFPHCPKCRRSMKFLAAVDSGITPFGRLNLPGKLFGFWCEEDSVSASRVQTL
jgi:hypothetical protein